MPVPAWGRARGIYGAAGAGGACSQQLPSSARDTRAVKRAGMLWLEPPGSVAGSAQSSPSTLDALRIWVAQKQAPPRAGGTICFLAPLGMWAALLSSLL